MPGPDRLELSAAAAVRPPVDRIVAGVARREQQGFDAVWWADHLLHWFPTSIWSQDLVPQAAATPSPHVWLDPFPVAATAATATSSVKLGVGVTDLVRRHPAALAQTALTMDHLTGGRFLLGVGTGESLNLAPIGLDNDRPLSRLREGLQIIRRLFDSPEAIDHDGEFFTLRGAAVGLRPLEGGPPPLWLAAHRPRVLALAGEVADGWLPLTTDPRRYAEWWSVVRGSAQAAGRADRVTPGLYARVLPAPTRQAAEDAIDGSLLLRFIALTLPDEVFVAHGAEHPLGRGAFGLTSFVPTAIGREEALRLAEGVPEGVLRDTVIHGTPDDVAARLGEFADAGARHIQLANLTPLADPALAAESEGLLGDVVTAVRAA
ncbi:MAG: LLM class flavin-dependent oxidoreductase [Miltoncostaeaceae bacterium]